MAESENQGSSTSQITDDTPNALQVWNNQARLSLSPPLAAWLALLVAVCLSSVFFVGEYTAARWVLGGFIASHLIVFLLPTVTDFVMRKGFVSLMHVICWTPGLAMIIGDVLQGPGGTSYAWWSYALIVVVAISFIFDVRDSYTYLVYLPGGKTRKPDKT